MTNLYHKIFLDVGIPLLGNIYGVGYGIIAFIIAVSVEAWIMRKRFPDIALSRCLKYAFYINMISTIFGIPLLFIASINMTNPETFSDYILMMFYTLTEIVILLMYVIFFLKWVLLAFGITVLVEFCGLIYLMKPRPSVKEALSYSFLANLASYLIITLIPTIYWVISVISNS